MPTSPLDEHDVSRTRARAPDASADPASRVPRRALLAVLVAAALAYLPFPGLWGWNQNSRLALVMAIVDRGSVSIDGYVDRAGLETGDTSSRDGRLYSDKAIGTALLGVPAYALVKPLLARSQPAPEHVAGIARTVVTWAAVSVPTALAVTLLYAFAWHAGAGARGATLVAAAAAMGTPAWPFATVLFGHALAAALLLAGFVLARWIRDGTTGHGPAFCSLAGASLGLAAISEYPVAPLAAMTWLYLMAACGTLARPQRRRARLLGAVAASVPIALLIAYNTVAMGSPFTLGYAHVTDPQFAAVHRQGLLGITLPEFDRLLYLTVHPVRGLFVQSPVLLAGLAGLVAMARRPGWRAEALLIGASCLLLAAINAGFPIWWGGYSFAPRHLVPIALLLCVPIAFVPRRLWPLVAALLALSIVQMAIPTITTPLSPDEPLRDALRQLGGDGLLPWAGASPIWTTGLAALSDGALRATLLSRTGLGAPLAFALLAGAIALAWGVAAAVGASPREPDAARTPTGPDDRGVGDRRTGT